MRTCPYFNLYYTWYNHITHTNLFRNFYYFPSYAQTCCEWHPAGSWALLCVARERPEEEQSHARGVLPRCTRDTLRSRTTRSKTPSPAEGTREDQNDTVMTKLLNKNNKPWLPKITHHICKPLSLGKDDASPCLRGWDRIAAGPSWRRWLTRERCAPRAASTLPPSVAPPSG